MRLKHTILTLVLATLALMADRPAVAQCNMAGQVIELPSSYSCGKVILAYQTSQILIPVNDPLDFPQGTELMFSYDSSTQTSSCTFPTAITVELTCLTAANDPPPNCIVGFSHQASFDVQVFTEFEPVTLDSALDYFWDFGDGATSSQMLPSHVFQGQGNYQVCLTMTGGDCTGETICKTIDLHECHAGFSYEATDGVVDFTNNSSGNFTQWEWSLGDGTTFLNQPVASYDYGNIGIYNVCLTVWNNSGCTQQFCGFVYTGTGDICDFTDCVLPGDTDASLAANVYDLLPIGVGYGAEGPPRSMNDVTTVLDWSPQYSSDWGLETINGIDYKHLDCNGDGTVNDADMEAIEVNYAEPEDIFLVQAPGETYFWLDFDWDTVVVTDNTPPFFTLEADLMAGTPSMPMQNLRGFAMQLNYPEDMVLDGSVEVDYNDNSFFGNSNGNLWLGRNRTDEGVMDMAFTRKSGHANGFGKVARVSFIVIADVIARSETEQPFTVTLDGVVAVNPEGAQLTLGEGGNEATVIVVNKITTSASEEQLAQQVSVFPNPTSHELWVRLDDLDGEQVALFNALGQRVLQMTFSGDQLRLDVSMLENGVYSVLVHTDQGIAMKRIVVE